MKLAIILLWFITSCFAGEIECLASGIYFEAGNQSYQGKLAVANVIKNRKEQWKLKNYCSVVYQVSNGRRQFLWKNPKLPDVKTANYDNWLKSLELANDFIANPNKYKDNTQGALFFHNNQVSPNWKRTKTITIQDHTFYR